MHIDRIGLTPLKGARHRELTSLRLDATGPVGDRVFCLVDVDRARVVRTVDHPSLVLVDAIWDGTDLTVRTPDGREVVEAPRPTGQLLPLDYWGREAQLELLESPHAQLFSDHLGRDLRLTRISRPGEVVYGGSVSMVSTGELAQLSETDSVRFRATITLDAERVPDPGTEVRVGDAVLRVRGTIPRCRVIDINPATGEQDREHLKTLAAQSHRAGELPFGVDADVVEPGTVRTGDQASVVPS